MSGTNLKLTTEACVIRDLAFYADGFILKSKDTDFVGCQFSYTEFSMESAIETSAFPNSEFIAVDLSVVHSLRGEALAQTTADPTTMHPSGERPVGWPSYDPNPDSDLPF